MSLRDLREDWYPLSEDQAERQEHAEDEMCLCHLPIKAGEILCLFRAGTPHG
jgi:hypothetical protein